MQSLWMLFASFIFAIMGVCVKLASDLYSTSEIVMYRGVIGATILLIVARLHRGSLRSALPLAHLWRGAVGVTALWLWFYSISLLPLATAMTLNYTAPIWIAVFLFAVSWWRRDKQDNKRIEWRFVVAIGMSFIGVALLLRPAVHANQWVGGIIALISGMLAAMAYLQVKSLSHRGEPEYRIVFYFCVSGIVAGLFGSLIASGISDHVQPLFHPHTLKGAALLIAIGITATSAQMAMTRAYRLGNTLIVANLQYTGIVFSSVWGIVMWHDVFGLMSWTGIAIILGSGMAATYYNTRQSGAASREVADSIANEI